MSLIENPSSSFVLRRVPLAVLADQKCLLLADSGGTGLDQLALVGVRYREVSRPTSQSAVSSATDPARTCAGTLTTFETRRKYCEVAPGTAPGIHAYSTADDAS